MAQLRGAKGASEYQELAQVWWEGGGREEEEGEGGVRPRQKRELLVSPDSDCN